MNVSGFTCLVAMRLQTIVTHGGCSPQAWVNISGIQQVALLG